MKEDVQPTLGNTRRITFAIWWKLCAVFWISPFLVGFLGYSIPWQQLQFWLATQIANVFGDAIFIDRGASLHDFVQFRRLGSSATAATPGT